MNLNLVKFQITQRAFAPLVEGRAALSAAPAIATSRTHFTHSRTRTPREAKYGNPNAGRQITAEIN